MKKRRKKENNEKNSKIQNNEKHEEIQNNENIRKFSRKIKGNNHYFVFPLTPALF